MTRGHRSLYLRAADDSILGRSRNRSRSEEGRIYAAATSYSSSSSGRYTDVGGCVTPIVLIDADELVLLLTIVVFIVLRFVLSDCVIFTRPS